MAANSQAGHGNPIIDVFRDTFKLVAETQRQAAAISDSAKKAVKAFYRNPADLASFIERHGTPVYVLNGGWLASFCLFALGYEPGFIAPAQGKRYQWLQKFLGWQGTRPNCHYKNGVFVLTPQLFTVGYISHQLHHWMACKAGLGGYTENAQSLYRKFWNENNGVVGHEVYDMTYEDILALKNAINRDLEALQFLKQIANEILIPGKQANHFSKNRSASA